VRPVARAPRSRPAGLRSGRRRWRCAALAVLGAIALGAPPAGCGGDEETTTITTEATTSSTTSTSATTSTTTRTDAGPEGGGGAGGGGSGEGGGSGTPQVDSEQNDLPPEPNSPQEDYERFCDENPEACS
jgi:hypothetical protein